MPQKLQRIDPQVGLECKYRRAHTGSWLRSWLTAIQSLNEQDLGHA